MAFRTVVGELRTPDNKPIKNEQVKFYLNPYGTETNEPVYPQSYVSVRTNEDGEFSKSLWVNEDSEKLSIYSVVLPTGERGNFILPSGVGEIDISDLLINHAPVAPSGQVPQEYENLAKRDASNIGAVQKEQWRTALDVGSSDNLSFTSLEVTNPRENGGVEADIGTLGEGTDGSKWIKAGESDTAWESIMISKDGVYVANVALQESSDIVLPEGVLGRVGDKPRLGDGETEGGQVLVSPHANMTVFILDDGTMVALAKTGTLLYTDTPEAATKVTAHASVGVGITSIGADAFNSTALATIALPDGLLTIGNNAFAFAEGLTTLTVPDSVTSIGNGSFSEIPFATPRPIILLGKGVESIGNAAFKQSIIGGVVLPEGLLTMGSEAFREADVSGVDGSIAVPNSVTTIGDDCFRQSWFTAITLGSGLVSIGLRLCKDMESLTTVNCYVTKTIIDTSTDIFDDSGAFESQPLTIHARADDDTWTAGPDQTIGGRTGVTVVKDL